MKLLVLGGSRFVGRHVVDAALARGHVVATFNRGVSGAPAAGVTALAGDRDPAVGRGLAALAGHTFDAVIDLSGYLPRVVAASARQLAGVRRYVFVSSVSAYRDTSRAGVDEDGPLAELADPLSEVLPRDYGALKAACERAVQHELGARATIVRPGLIVGPLDATDRFAYWVARFAHPSLLGARAGHAVVHAPATAPIQLIDARDLATWLVDLAGREEGGTYNAVSAAGQWTMQDVVDAAAALHASPPAPVWTPTSLLLAHDVEPWTGLPLWLPETEPDFAGFMHIDGRRAAGAGLVVRPLAATVADTAGWLLQRDNASAWKLTLSAARERQILAAAGISI